MKTSQRISVIAILCLLIVAAGVLGYFTVGYTDWSFNPPLENEQQVEQPENRPRMALAYRALPASADEEGITQYEVSATLRPYDIPNAINWHVEYAPPTSVSMPAIDNYADMQVSEDCKTAHITLKKRLDFRIRIVATYKFDESISAYCNIDYLCRQTRKTAPNGYSTGEKPLIMDGSNYVLTPYDGETTGTVHGTVRASKVNVVLNDYVISRMNEVSAVFGDAIRFNTTITPSFTVSNNTIYNFNLAITDFIEIVGEANEYKTFAYNTAYNFLIDVLSKQSAQAQMWCDMELVYRNTVYDHFESNHVSVAFDTSACVKKPSDVTLDLSDYGIIV